MAAEAVLSSVLSNYPISKLLGVCDRVKHTRTFLEINLEREIPFNMENAPCILLSKLKYLRALSFDCFPLESLPDSIGELIHLRYLDLSRTDIMTLPDTLCNLYNLQTLKLVLCKKLKALPVGMKDLTNLRYLDISGTGLHEMPEGMSKLTSLQVLSNYVVGKREGNKINELGALANLHQTIWIDKLENVVNSSEALGAKMFDKDGIECLVLEWSPDEYENTDDSQIEREILEELRPHSNLKQLQIWGYRGTTFPDWLGHCSYHSITQIILGDFFSDLPNQLPSLEDLTIHNCEQLSSCVPRASGITCLRIEGNKEVRIGELPPLLDKLSITGKHQAESVMEAIAHTQLTCLRSLIISNCSSHVLFAVSSIPASLQELTISNCKKLEFEMEGQHHSLHYLTIRNSCDSVTSFSLDSFPNLVGVEIRECEKMESLVVSRSLSCLRSLEINNCGSLKSLQTLWMASPQLEYLSLRGCPEIDLSAIGDPQRSLRSLSISYCEKQLSCVASQFDGLTHIKGENESVKCLPKEGWLPATLESLTLDRIKSVEMLECKGLAHLISLQQLCIYECYNLENIDGEKLPASLLRLSISESPLGKRCEMKDPQVWPKISHIPAIQLFQQEITSAVTILLMKATKQSGTIMDTIQEIQKWHDTVIDIESSLNELHQVLLDMTVLVQSQGKQLNDIESHESKANSYVCRGSGSFSLQGSTRRIPEVHLHCHHNIDLLY
ncbi:hypothetical protein Ahy_B10g106094 isoform A [Arachis hypogaea]|uniref:t-SNARE coiled-coil homology domain-containing protein n=1 Tax=Arachis hypogaea TaxID=3818 RepID=A0A444X9S2_ARAHY|nr:hypothetical protein Ahy_B10g106094 isoform A [Arachis hypogaea]